MELKKKIAFVIGVRDGIGAAYTKGLKENEWDEKRKIRNERKINLFKKSIYSMSNIFKSYKCDVQDIKKLQKIANENQAPTLLFLNAGIYNPIDSTKSNIEIYKEHFNVNYLGVINCYEAFLPKMLKNGDGKIIIMSSISGWVGLPKAAAYGPTKAALRSFAQSIRYDLAPKGISVQVCSPGFVKTSATSINDFYMPGLMEAEDAAKLIFKNMYKKKFEFSFPFSFSIFMRILSVLPDNLSSFLIKKSVQ